ncbi:hypothetical protein [Methanocella sp. MCL-LM]|uniref:hypothetical protein n=1 Tax=Methanocella sp. MCL-LM TaxID=3412035 RepID=UPI003C793F99
MFKQIIVILVVIALALTVTGCCCCGGSGYDYYYSEVENTAAGCACEQCESSGTCAAGGCQAGCGI